MRKALLSVIIVSGIILSMISSSVTVVFAFSNDVIREKTFTTYYVNPIGTPSTDSYNVYAYSGVHWSTGKVVTYYVNSKGAPTGAIIAIKKAFETWDGQIGNRLFNDNVQVANSKLVGNRYDGKNVVSWGRLGQGIIAQTTVWYYTTTKEIVEFGMVFNTAYKWGIDADGKGSTYTLTNAFDVQNIATHEAGHTLMLEDLYTQATNALTMYGYGSYGQTYALSLGAGDISGIKAVYP
ncbi:MAG: hypothetical protein QG670_2475 [Thermoproteota archaeon]|nr:hypothetical protein [Thermoproteota archaeon]